MRSKLSNYTRKIIYVLVTFKDWESEVAKEWAKKNKKYIYDMWIASRPAGEVADDINGNKKEKPKPCKREHCEVCGTGDCSA